MIDAHRVVFNGFDSLNFDLTPHFSFDSDNGNTTTHLNRDSIHSESYGGFRRNIHGYKYNDILAPQFTFIKSDFSDLTPEEHRRILSWMTASDKPGWIQIFQDDTNALSYQLWGSFTQIDDYKLGNGRIVGIIATFEAAHPYAFSRKLTHPEIHEDIPEVSNNNETNDYLTVDGTNTFTLTCNTDEYNKPLYPKVTINFKGENPYFPIDVDPLENTTHEMVPNTIYSYEDKLYVSLNKVGHEGRYATRALASDTPASSATVEYKYYYFPEENYIKTTVVKDDEYVWEPVTPIGMAVRIENGTTGNETIVSGAAIGETVVLDGTNKVISGVKSDIPRIIGDDFNFEWPAFVYGDNTITVMGNCEIKFEWLEPRKVGSL